MLQGLGLNPTGLPTEGTGAQKFIAELGQNLQAGAARAVINTAINGGSLEDSLRNSIKTPFIDTLAAQGANQIGDWTQAGTLDEVTNKLAHAIAGCAIGAAKADNSGGCGAGALGAAIGELSAELYGDNFDTVQFAAMIGGIAVAIAGGDAAAINLGSQSASNAAANNSLLHPSNTLEAGIRQAILRGDAAELRLLLGETGLSTADAAVAQRILSAMEAVGPQNARMLADRYGADWINKVGHIFEGAHQGPVGAALVQQFGSPAAAFAEVQVAVDALNLTAAGQSTVAVIVQGTLVTVRVFVVNGVAKISTILKW